MSYSKPLPGINSDNRPFWEGCRQHELKFQKCSQCGHVRWPAAFLCPQCHSTKTEWLISKGIGSVYTFSIYHTAFHPGFADDLPYTTAVVKLDEGPHLMTNIVACSPEDVVCDMPVEVVWEDVTDEISLPKFRPRKNKA